MFKQFCYICQNTKFLSFVGGAATALIGGRVLKSQATRKTVVAGLAKGMKLQSDAQVVFQNMKEEASDLCHDAKVEAGATEK